MQSHPSTFRSTRICSRQFTPYTTTPSGGSGSWGVGSRRLLALLAAVLPCTSAVSADVTSTWVGPRANPLTGLGEGIGSWSTGPWTNSPSLGGTPQNGNAGVATYDAVIGTGDVTLAGNITIESFTLSGGILRPYQVAAGASLFLNQNLTWTGGSLLVDATAAGHASTISGSVHLERTLTNTGTMSGVLFTISGTLNNTGTFNDGGDIFGSGTINNSGVWNFSRRGSGSFLDTIRFRNTGTVNVQGPGTMTLGHYEAGTTGALNIASDGILHFRPGSFTMASTSSISGAGSVVFNALSAQSGTYNVNGSYNITGSTAITGGNVNFNSTSQTVGDLTVAGGTLDGSGSLNIRNLIWTGGTMRGTGTATVAGSASTIGGTEQKILGLTLNNTGTMTFGSAAGIHLGSGALNNSGIFNTTAGGDFTNSGWSIINNSGTWNVSGAGTTSTHGLSAWFNNTGTVNVQSGTLEFYGGDLSRANVPSAGSTTGAYNILADGKLLIRAGTYTLANSSSIAGAGAVEFNGGQLQINGTYNVSGSTTFSGADVTFNAPITSLGNNGSLTVRGALTFNSTVPTLTSLTISEGSLGGTAPIMVTGNLIWNGGILGGTGTTTVAGSASTISGTAEKVLVRTLNNTGTMTYESAAGVIRLASPTAPFNNSGTFNTTAGGDFTNIGSSLINNSGTWNVSGPGTTSSHQGRFNNTGTVNVQSGILDFYGGDSANTTGAYNISSDGKLLIRGGTYTFANSSSIAGAGAIEFNNGQLQINGTYNVTGSTTFSGADVTFNAPVTSLGNNGSLNVGGTINFNSTVPALTNLTVPAGTIGGSASIDVTQNLTWSGGTMGGSGTVTVAGSASTIGGTGAKTLIRTLTNTGTMTFTATSDNGTSLAFGSATGVLNNSGTFNVVGGADFGSGGTINNSGTWNVSGAGTTSTIGSVFNNSGTVNVASGAVVYNGGFKQTGGSLAFNGSNFTTSTPINVESGTVTGNGTITGRLNNIGGTISPGNSPGALNIVGDLTLGNSSTLAMELGGRTQGTEYDLLSETGTIALTLDGLLSVKFLNGFENSILSSDVFTLLTSNQALLGAFDNVASGSRLNTADGLGSFLVSYGAGSPFSADKVVLSQFAIPEPSSALLLASAGGLLLMRRRRASRR